MRRLLVALALLAWMPHALAGEYELPTLRGSEPLVPVAPVQVIPRWSGFYVGGQVGMGIGSMDFAGTTQPLVAHMLRELRLEAENRVSTWEVLGKGDTRSASVGGFVGYNNAWEGMIIGVDFNWSRMNYSIDAPVFPIGRLSTTTTDLVYATTLTGSGFMRITDFGTLRVRAGVELGNFMPYAGIGIAVGRADVVRTATVYGTETTPTDPPVVTPFFFTEAESKYGAVIYGWSLSGGLDIMLMPSVFMRAEFEFVNFQPLWNIKSSISTGRLGLGYKF
jgi:outer membrane immunogenic protein